MSNLSGDVQSQVSDVQSVVIARATGYLFECICPSSSSRIVVEERTRRIPFESPENTREPVHCAALKGGTFNQV